MGLWKSSASFGTHNAKKKVTNRRDCKTPSLCTPAYDHLSLIHYTSTIEEKIGEIFLWWWEIATWCLNTFSSQIFYNENPNVLYSRAFSAWAIVRLKIQGNRGIYREFFHTGDMEDSPHDQCVELRSVGAHPIIFWKLEINCEISSI